MQEHVRTCMRVCVCLPLGPPPLTDFKYTIQHYYHHHIVHYSHRFTYPASRTLCKHRPAPPISLCPSPVASELYIPDNLTILDTRERSWSISPFTTGLFCSAQTFEAIKSALLPLSSHDDSSRQQQSGSVSGGEKLFLIFILCTQSN